jgi:hypothetical protein
VDECKRGVYDVRSRLRALEKSGTGRAIVNPAPQAPAKGPSRVQTTRAQNPTLRLSMNSRIHSISVKIAKQFAEFNQRLQRGTGVAIGQGSRRADRDHA